MNKLGEMTSEKFVFNDITLGRGDIYYTTQVPGKTNKIPYNFSPVNLF
jgi:hypothetical protein